MDNEQSHLEIHEFAAGLRERLPLIQGLRDAARVFWRYRWQLRVQFARSMRGRFAKSYLGTFWALLLPIVPVSAYLFLRLLFAPTPTDGIHSAIYVGMGVSLWFLISGAMLAPMQAIAKQSGMLSRSHFPVTVAIAGELLDTLFETVIRMLFLVPFLFWLAEPTLMGVLCGVAAAFSMFLFATGVGCYLMLLTLIVPDTRTVVEVLMRYLIFLSLAIFPLPANVWGSALSTYNPFAVLIDSTRSLIVDSTLNMPIPFAVVVILSLLLFATGVYFVHASERQIRGLL